MAWGWGLSTGRVEMLSIALCCQRVNAAGERGGRRSRRQGWVWGLKLGTSSAARNKQLEVEGRSKFGCACHTEEACKGRAWIKSGVRTEDGEELRGVWGTGGSRRSPSKQLRQGWRCAPNRRRDLRGGGPSSVLVGVTDGSRGCHSGAGIERQICDTKSCSPTRSPHLSSALIEMRPP